MQDFPAEGGKTEPVQSYDSGQLHDPSEVKQCIVREGEES